MDPKQIQQAVEPLKKWKPRTVIIRMHVVCMECEHKFATTSMLPECPKCNSGDIELQ